MILNDKSAQFYFDEIDTLWNDFIVNKTVSFGKIKTLLNKICLDAAENENQFFSSAYSRLVFIINKYKVPDELGGYIKQASFLTSRFISDKGSGTEEDFISVIQILIRTVKFFSGLEYPESLKNILNMNVLFRGFWESFDKPEELIDLKGIVFKEKPSTNTDSIAKLIFESENFGIVKIRFYGIWKIIPKMLWKGAVLNCFNLKLISKKENILATSPSSIIVLEPDYLMDVTDIAECFHSKGFNQYLYFLRKFFRPESSFNLTLGNLINSCLDELILNPKSDLDTIYSNFIRNKPLQVFALAEKKPESVKMLRPAASVQYSLLKKAALKIKEGAISIEPSFISPDYGLQGRLDLMIESKENGEEKDIVELKSGNPPSTEIFYRDENGNSIPAGVWHNHLAQTTCYNMLLDSAYEKRSGSSMILYSRSEDLPFRNVPNIISKKQQVMNARNWIVALEKSLQSGNFSLLESLNPSGFGTHPPFIDKEIEKFSKYYDIAAPIEKNYFHAYISFILREIFSTKSGSDGKRENGSFSSLWNATKKDKKKNKHLISGLKLIAEESDFQNLHINFEIDLNIVRGSRFRIGDYLIVYPDEGPDSSAVKRQLFKCVIKDISNSRLTVSFRNKLTDTVIFHKYDYWLAESDHSDTNLKNLYRELFSFLSSDQRTKELLLGMRKPESKKIDQFADPELNINQNEILNEALAADDYFLIQGPPGTGKTSYMLRSIVHYISRESSNNIIVLAYTNRAVDQICSALKNLKKGTGFLRLGAKETSEHSDVMISYIAHEITVKELYEKIKSVKIYVSTVASALSNKEIFEIKNFDMAIIDEASQILEPQIIGILSRVRKFIMIGDAKQLPAVVAQPDKANKIKSQEFLNINLTDLRNSLFERLLTTCKNNGWENAYGSLNYQARMHKDIQKLANTFFYSGKLEIFPDSVWQKEKLTLPVLKKDDNILSLLSSSRLIFINTPKDSNYKKNMAESETAVMLIEKYYKIFSNDFDENSIGVITPYRAQCSEILHKLPEEIADLVTVDTVERFQGSERDIIIFSFAINHEHQFSEISSFCRLDDELIDRKLNVALTRAKKQLIILGNENVLKYSDYYAGLIDYFKENGALINYYEIIS